MGDTRPLSDLMASPYARPPFIRTDGLYSLEGYGGDLYGGLDVLDEDGSRYWVTSGRSAAAERRIRDHLGEKAVFEHAADDESGLSVYRLSRGTLPLRRILDTSPFSPAYMARLHDQARTLIHDLRGLDEHGFGVTLDHLAFTYDGPMDADPVPDFSFICVIPPVVR